MSNPWNAEPGELTSDDDRNNAETMARLEEIRDAIEHLEDEQADHGNTIVRAEAIRKLEAQLDAIAREWL
ncbi:MAG: hypothetical protein GY766_28315 [Herbaspirillum sp.]|uniref:hypothetical protein n=1 Tax=Herbaspirillum sp. TaxID=1890675 RepID=UPI00258701D8|nr:hypothetical protein [Herbaspirillum sp.]MCP3658765.1 hypothetical protein [Herbaspirillum sp.]